MYQKFFQDFASLILTLALSLSGFSPASPAQPENIQAEECISQTGAAYPCEGSTASTASVDAAAEALPNPGDQIHRVAVFHDEAVSAGQGLANVLNADPEIVATAVTREFVEAGGLAEFSCVVARLPGFGDTPTAATVQAIQEFVAGGGGYIGEWWGTGAALSGAAPSVDGDYGIPARFLSLFAGSASDGGQLNSDQSITVVQDHPVVQGLSGTFSGGGGTEFFVRAAPPLDSNLTVLATYEGHGGTNPAIMVGQSGPSNAVLLFFDAMDEPANAHLNQLWLNSVKFACPLQEFQPPSNDNFVNAEAITALPFTATVLMTEATKEPNEPESCTFMDRTVWYSFTPTENIVVRADTSGGTISGNVNVYHSLEPGITNLNFLGCSSGIIPFSFLAEAGQTYYLQAGAAFGQFGSLQVNLQQVIPPANDNFTDAEAITTLPFTATVDISDATNEASESQACVFMERTAWYSFTPTENVAVRADTLGGAITGNVNIYLSSGPEIADLSFLGCSVNNNGSLGFYAEAGRTYYLQAGAAFGEVGSIQINLEQSFPPVNDNFANAEAITSLPFSAMVNQTDATTEVNEPQICFGMGRTVWYSFLATENMLMRANTLGSEINANVNIYRAFGPGITDLEFLGCSGPSDSPTFVAEAGQTYYLQAGGHGELGNIQVNLEQILPPPNDDFDNAITVNALPFSNTQDTTAATSAADDPTDCSNNGSVWYQFTPANDTTLVAVANTFGSSYDTVLSVYTGSRGALQQIPGGCNDDSSGLQSRIAFDATGGTTYYFMIGFCCGNGGAGGGNLVFSVDEAPVPSNDNFANAASINSLPTTIDFDTTAATVESGEPAPSCAQPMYYTLWYAFTPSTTGSVSAGMFNQSFNSFFAVYSGTGLNDLAELGCRQGGLLTFTATAGQTYYIQVGSVTEGSRGSGTLSLETTSAPQVGFNYSPGDPSVLDTIQFCDNSFDPGEVGFESFTWDFGDGATASDQCPTHRYTVAGDYTVQHTATTFDGRTGSTSQIIQVRTHDVTITKVDAPDSGRVGQTKNISVQVRNDGNPGPETVTIELYRSVPGGGFEFVTSLTQTVPTSRRGRATKFTFQYTFTAQDAALGKVIFRAVANIDGLRDSFPQDNERLSLLTTIRRPANYPNP